MTLISAITWIISDGGAAYLAFQLVERWRVLAGLAAEAKRIVAFALSAVIACIVFAVAVTIFNYVEIAVIPSGWQEWVEALFEIAAGAIIAGQLLHGRKVLSKRN